MDLSKIDKFIEKNMVYDESDKVQYSSYLYNPINHNDQNEKNMINTDNLDISIMEDDPTKKKLLCNRKILKTPTDFISSTFFTDDRQKHIFKFQYLINNSFNKMTESLIKDINNFIKTNNLGNLLRDTDIIFLYKGGTTLKILYDTYLEKLQHSNNNEFFERFKDDFKRSDSDYVFMINPNINIQKNGISFAYVYKMVNYRVSDILYNISLFLYNDSISEKPEILDFSLISSTELQKFIDEIDGSIKEIQQDQSNSVCTKYFNCDKIIKIGYANKIYTSNDESTKLYEDNIDSLKDDMKSTFTVITNSSDLLGKKIIGNPINELNYKLIDTNINFSINDSIDIEYKKSPTGIADSFCLQRLKLKFVIYYINKSGLLGNFSCPGELIDIVILRQNSLGLHYFYDNFEKEYQIYVYHLFNKRITFKSYSIYGQITDLLYVLFGSDELPWYDKKYKKRIYRLTLLLIFNLYDNNNNNKDLKKNIDEYINLFIILIRFFNDKNNLIRFLNDKIKEDNKINKNLLNYLKDLFESDSINENEYKNYSNLIQIFLNQFKSFKTDNIYNIDTITEQLKGLDLYGVRVPQIGGEFKQKYLKYKQKYLQMKKLI